MPNEITWPDRAFYLAHGMSQHILNFTDLAIQKCSKPTYFDYFIERAFVYELSIEQMSRVLLFEKAEMLNPTLHSAKTLYAEKPPGSEPSQKDTFLHKIDKEYTSLEEIAMQKAATLVYSSNKLIPQNLVLYELEAQKEKRFNELFDRYEASSQPLDQEKKNRMRWIYESLSDISKLFLDLSLGDIGKMNCDFETHSSLYFSLMVFLDYGYFCNMDSLLNYDLSIIGRVLWSLEQQQSLPEEILSASEKARAMTRYGLLLTTLQDHMYRKAIFPLLQKQITKLEEQNVGEDNPQLSALYELLDTYSIAQIRLDTLQEIIYPPNPLPHDKDNYFLQIDPDKSGSIPLVSALHGSHFGTWFASRLSNNDQHKQPLPIEISQKSLLNMVLQYIYPGLSYRDKIKKILEALSPNNTLNQDQINTVDNLYNCEVIPTLFAEICASHPEMATNPHNFSTSTEAFRMRMYVQPAEFESVITALNQDNLPFILGGINDAQDLIGHANAPVYLFSDQNGEKKVIPISKDVPFNGDVYKTIIDAFSANEFAALFIHYTIPNTSIGPVVIELQILPEAVQEQYYHSQRRSFLNKRVG